MSRKQKKPRRRISKSHAAYRIGWVMKGFAYQSHSEESYSKLMLQAYALLVSLERGALDIEGFWHLNEINSLGYSFMSILHAEGSEAVKADMKRREPIPLAASDALEAIGLRYNRTGKFGASGNELKALRATVTNLDELSKASPTAVFVRAVELSARRLDEYLKQKRKQEQAA